MTNARPGHTATLLPNGQVLVAGGGWGASTATLYNPDTGKWTITASMAMSRTGHTVTLLPSGQVLVVGGLSNGEDPSGHVLSSAELYNPRTGQWSLTGSMVTPRYYHTAILLANGKVLVAGGWQKGTDNPNRPVSSAELYDPCTRRWTPTGNMTMARMSAPAVLLAHSKVLVVGGCGVTDQNECQELASAEIYDPKIGAWTPTCSMASPRSGHTATALPSGQVLAIGGCTGQKGQNGCHPLSSAEVYDPGTGRWTVAGSMASPRVGHTATLLQTGDILVAGGCCDRTGGVMSSAELYTGATAVQVNIGPSTLDFGPQLGMVQK